MIGAGTTMIVLFAAVVVAVSHADAASRQVPAARYVHRVCVAVSTWEQRVAVAGLSTPRRLRERKRVLRAYFRDLVRYARAAVKSLKRAGAPAVPGGAHIAAAVRGAFHDTLVGLEKALTAANRMPTSSGRAFGKATKTIMQRLVDALGTTVSALATVSDSPALDAAASRDPACA